MRKISVGDLRHKVTVQYLKKSVDAYGAPIQDWEDLGNMWVKIEPLTGREYWAAAQVQADHMYRITSRWHPGLIRSRDNVRVTGRLLFGSRVFEIISVANLEERNMWMELICREKVS